MLSTGQKIRRGFHWLAAILAAILLSVGLALMTFDVSDFWHGGEGDTPSASAICFSARLGYFSLAGCCGPLFALSGGSWLGSIVDSKPTS
jgi:hypothetical protein